MADGAPNAGETSVVHSVKCAARCNIFLHYYYGNSYYGQLLTDQGLKSDTPHYLTIALPGLCYRQFPASLL